MHGTQRVVFAAVILALAIFRLINYLRAGARAGRTRQAAIPASGAMLTPTTSAAPGASPVASAARPLLGRAVSALVWLTGNIVLWLALFATPALADTPVVWRLVAGVFVNFFLLRLARAAGDRLQNAPLAGRHPDDPIR